MENIQKSFCADQLQLLGCKSVWFVLFCCNCQVFVIQGCCLISFSHEGMVNRKWMFWLAWKTTDTKKPERFCLWCGIVQRPDGRIGLAWRRQSVVGDEASNFEFEPNPMTHPHILLTSAHNPQHSCCSYSHFLFQTFIILYHLNCTFGSHFTLLFCLEVVGDHSHLGNE